MSLKNTEFQIKDIDSDFESDSLGLAYLEFLGTSHLCHDGKMRRHARDDFVEALRVLHSSPKLLPEDARRQRPGDLNACVSGTEKSFTGRVFWISDLHLFHSNILSFVGKEKRPFEDMETMNEVLVANILDTIQKDDILIFVGDITFEKPDSGTYPKTNEILKEVWSSCAYTINIVGNHDVNKKMELMDLHFDETRASLTLDYSGRPILVTHYPVSMKVLDLKADALNIHGHTHSDISEAPIVEALYPSNYAGLYRHLSACVESNELRPIDLGKMISQNSGKNFSRDSCTVTVEAPDLTSRLYDISGQGAPDD